MIRISQIKLPVEHTMEELKRAAARELAGAEEDLARCQAELERLDGCEERYTALLREKTQAVKAAGGAAAEQILRMEEREAYLESQVRELGEACAAGFSLRSSRKTPLPAEATANSWHCERK